MNEIKVEIVADSVNQQGDRLTSLVLTYPRIIHAEMMTHRMFSRNASSSRAVPVQKMIEAVKNNTFCPFEFQKAHKGMQGSEYFTGQDKEDCIKLWLESAELALQQAEKMKEKGITKQIINRILEPYQYYTVLITGSREGWENFFNLRCPQYNWQNEGNFKSWKDLVKSHFNNGASRNWIDELEQSTTLERLQNNKGQAEIHMMALAECIYDAMNESTPKQLKAGEWHIPFYNKIYPIVERVFKDIPDNECWNGDFNEKMIAISTAMSARTSYTIVGNEKEIEYKKMVELHDRLLSQDPPHSSPLEHCARAMSDKEYYSFIKGSFIQEMEIDSDGFIDISTHANNSNSFGWCNNLKGFIPYRYFIDNNRNFINNPKEKNG